MIDAEIKRSCFVQVVNFSCPYQIEGKDYFLLEQYDLKVRISDSDDLEFEFYYQTEAECTLMYLILYTHKPLDYSYLSTLLTENTRNN